MNDLDISLLIDKTQEFINDDRIHFAEEGECVVQNITIEAKTYQLIVKLKFIANEN